MAINRTEILGHASGTEALFADLSYFPVQAIQVTYCLYLLQAVKMFL
jgi:hypothetical protein